MSGIQFRVLFLSGIVMIAEPMLKCLCRMKESDFVKVAYELNLSKDILKKLREECDRTGFRVEGVLQMIISEHYGVKWEDNASLCVSEELGKVEI